MPGQKQHVVVVNVPTSTIARESGVIMPTARGEIGWPRPRPSLASSRCSPVSHRGRRARGVLSEDDERWSAR
jgi:hypothetical protein